MKGSARPPSLEVMAALRELQEAYAEALPGLVAALGDALNKARVDGKAGLELSRLLSHRLRGTAGSYGFFGVSEAAAGIEKAMSALLGDGEGEEQRELLWKRVDGLLLSMEEQARQAVLDVRRPKV